MRKLKFNSQLLVLFLILLLISTGLFGLIVINRVHSISQVQTYERLESFIQITKDDWENLEDSPSSDNIINIGTILGSYNINSSKSDVLKMSENIKDILNINYLTEVLDSIKLEENTSGHNMIKLSNRNIIYYAYKITPVENGYSTFIIALTNNSYASSFSNSTSSQIILIFGVVFIFAFFILGLWSNSYVSRINRLKLHIANLTGSNYKEEYEDDGLDELADLSKSVEQMRLAILKNEYTKQEMLQNISHDFKTPIAVIKSYAEAIEDGMASTTDAKIIQNQASVLQHKVNILLQYNRLEYLEKKEPFIDCSIKEIVNNVVSSYQYQKLNIEFILDLDDSCFKGYVENFYTVIDNIVDNAKRYAKTCIKITLKDGVLKIYNDGEHIAQHFLTGTFKPYEKGSKGQFGLGMSIVKKTLDFFEYDLSVKNEEIGVTFEIKKHKNVNIYTQ